MSPKIGSTRILSISVLMACLLVAGVIARSIPSAAADDADPLKLMPTTQPTRGNAAGASAPAPTGGMQSKTSVSGDPEPRREPDPTAVLRALTSEQNTAPRPVVLPNRPNQIRSTVLAPEAIPANAIRPVSNRLLPDGYRLVDRTGRLTREGDYYVFAFESRSEGEAEAPVRLLPNRLLEDMEDFSEGGTKSVVFVVSGELTEYHGVNYLLLQKLLTRPNLGNLK